MNKNEQVVGVNEISGTDPVSLGDFGAQLSSMAEKFIKEAKGLADAHGAKLDVVIRFGLIDASKQQGE